MNIRSALLGLLARASCFGFFLAILLLLGGCGGSEQKVIMPEKPTPLPDPSLRMGRAKEVPEDAVQTVQPLEEK